MISKKNLAVIALAFAAGVSTSLQKSPDSRRANCPETKSWPLGQAIWLAVLLAHLGLATVQATPEIAAWGVSYNG
jgi:hypothetical protein